MSSLCLCAREKRPQRHHGQPLGSARPGPSQLTHDCHPGDHTHHLRGFSSAIFRLFASCVCSLFVTNSLNFSSFLITFSSHCIAPASRARHCSEWTCRVQIYRAVFAATVLKHVLDVVVTLSSVETRLSASTTFAAETSGFCTFIRLNLIAPRRARLHEALAVHGPDVHCRASLPRISFQSSSTFAKTSKRLEVSILRLWPPDSSSPDVDLTGTGPSDVVLHCVSWPVVRTLTRLVTDRAAGPASALAPLPVAFHVTTLS